jgi:hypothetical protein
MAAEYISEAAARGFGGAKERRRARARKAGLASGARRRQMCDPQKRRVKQRELALNFRVRLVARQEFERRDMQRRIDLGLNPSERGTETLWQEYMSCARAYKAKGQGFVTTNGQRAEALKKAGRPRCERTVRRAHRALAEMGLLRRYHDRRGGAAAGNRDRLRVQFTPIFVPLPSAAKALSPTGRESFSPAPKRGDIQGRTTSAAPPDGGRVDIPASPGWDGSNQEWESEPLTGRWAQLALDWGLERPVYAASGGSS